MTPGYTIPSPWITADQATEEGWYWVSTETYPARLEVTPTGDRYIWRRGSQPMRVPDAAMFCRIQPKPAI